MERIRYVSGYNVSNRKGGTLGESYSESLQLTADVQGYDLYNNMHVCVHAIYKGRALKQHAAVTLNYLLE